MTLATAAPAAATAGLFSRGLAASRLFGARMRTRIGFVWAFSAVLVLLVWAGGYAMAELVRNKRQELLTVAINTHSRGLQADVERILGQADDALKQVSLAYVTDASGVEALLNRRVVDAAALPSLIVLDANGKRRAQASSELARPDGPLPEDFAAHQRKDSGGVLLSKPLKDATTGAWSVQLSRRINRPDGSFGGTVMASVDLQQVSRLLSEWVMLPGSDHILMRQDGVILARHGEKTTDFTGSVDDAALLEAVNQANPVVATHTMTGPDGQERRYRHQTIPGFPLVLLQGVTPQSMDSAGRAARAVFFGMGGAWTVFILITSIVLTRTMKAAGSAKARRNRAETALRDSEERLRLAMVGGGVGDWEINFPEASMFVSRELHTMLGYVSDGRLLPQQEWLSFLHPQDLDRAKRALTETYAGAKEDYLLEVRLRTKNEQFRWLALQGKVKRDRARRVVNIAGLARDISDVKFASDQVEDRNAQLATIFQLSPDAFVSFDVQQRVKYVNPAFTRITGWQIGDVEGLAEALFSERLGRLCLPARPFMGVAALRALNDSIEGPRSVLIELAQSPRRLLRVSLRVSKAESMSQILSLRDVTQEALAEEMKTEFLSTAAHELRTPMTGILGFAEILSTETLKPEKQAEFANIIWRQAQNLTGILDELLDLTRIESLADKDFVFEAVELQALVHEVVEAFGLPEGRQAPEVTVTTAYCRADRNKLRQVILNVLSNAYKYSKPGNAVSITLALPSDPQAAGENTVSLIVRDEGIGMTAAQLERIFERFYRADASGAVPGTGLGMTIVKEIISALSGEINVSSMPGKGTTVRLTLPLAQAPGRGA